MDLIVTFILGGLFMLWWASCVPIISVMLLMNSLRRYALFRRLPIQFSLSDIYILMTMLSFSGLLLSTIPEMEARLSAIAVIWVGLAASWCYGVILVSRAGILSMRRRLLIQLIATPFAACGPYLILAGLVGIFVASPKDSLEVPGEATVQFFWKNFTLPRSQADLLQVSLGIAWLVLVVLYFWLPVHLARRMVEVEKSELPPEPIAAPAPPLAERGT
jgi:hypothetical protein